MNSNIISYSLSLLEIGLLSGCVWGFSFLQYIFEQELLFYDDLCLQDCLTVKSDYELVSLTDHTMNQPHISMLTQDALSRTSMLTLKN